MYEGAIYRRQESPEGTQSPTRTPETDGPSTTPRPTSPPPSSTRQQTSTPPPSSSDPPPSSRPSSTPSSSRSATPTSSPTSQTSAPPSSSPAPTTSIPSSTVRSTTPVSVPTSTVPSSTLSIFTPSSRLSTSSLTRFASTASDGEVFTVTQEVSGKSTNLSNSDGGNGFFANKGAVAATFIVVGLAGTAIVLLSAILLIKRRRKKRFERDVALTEAAARNTASRPPFNPRPQSDTLDIHPDDNPYSADSHGSYHQPPMAQAERYNYPVSSAYGGQYDYGQYNQGYDNNYYNAAYLQAPTQQNYGQPTRNSQYEAAQEAYVHDAYTTGASQPQRPARSNSNSGYNSSAPAVRSRSIGNRGLPPPQIQVQDDASFMSRYSDEDGPVVTQGGYGGHGRLKVANE